MTFLDFVIGALGVLLFGRRLFRLVVGYRCTACHGPRLRLVGAFHETFRGYTEYLACPSCKAEFVRRGSRRPERIRA
jgi:hypothetical protein